MKWLGFAVVLLAVSGCRPRLYPYTQSSLTNYPRRPAACAFQVQSTAPPRDEYEEIGTVGGCAGTNDLGVYKERIAQQVCGAGGDLLVGEINSRGVYCRGVVFRKRVGSIAEQDPSVPPRPNDGSCSTAAHCNGNEYCNSHQRCCPRGKACQAP